MELMASLCNSGNHKSLVSPPLLREIHCLVPASCVAVAGPPSSAEQGRTFLMANFVLGKQKVNLEWQFSDAPLCTNLLPLPWLSIC